MGADIHAYIERIETSRNHKEEPYTQVWSVAKLSIMRNYALFGLMGYQGRDLEAKLFAARGLPEGETGGQWEEEYWCFVCAKEDEESIRNRYATPATAERWIGHGSRYKRDANGEISLWDGIPCYVSDPDLHSVSWLTTDEFARVVAEFEDNFDGRKSWAWSQVNGALAMMRAIENSTDGRDRCRIIFAFDN